MTDEWRHEFPCRAWRTSLSWLQPFWYKPQRYSAEGQNCFWPSGGQCWWNTLWNILQRSPFGEECCFSQRECVESCWNWLIGVESSTTLICCYSLFFSTLHVACLTASAFLISTPPLGCCLNAADLINLDLSICDIKNAVTRILAQDLGNVIELAETCPEPRAMMSQDLSSVLLPAEIFVCFSMSLGGVSV